MIWNHFVLQSIIITIVIFIIDGNLVSSKHSILNREKVMRIFYPYFLFLLFSELFICLLSHLYHFSAIIWEVFDLNFNYNANFNFNINFTIFDCTVLNCSVMLLSDAFFHLLLIGLIQRLIATYCSSPRPVLFIGTADSQWCTCAGTVQWGRRLSVGVAVRTAVEFVSWIKNDII